MGDLLPPFITAIGGLLGLGILKVLLPRLQQFGFGDNRDCVREKAALRADLEATEEKVRILVADVAERDEALGVKSRDLASALLTLDFVRRAGDEARRELDDVRSEIRQKARSPRARTRTADR